MNSREAEERKARDKYFDIKKDYAKLTNVNLRLWYPSFGHPNLLQLAVFYGHGEFVNELIRRGADVNVVTEILGTALHIAVRQGNLSMIEKLLTAGANRNIFSLPCDSTLRRCTPIYAALEYYDSYSDDQFIKVLLENGSDVDGICFINRWDPNGRTPLQIAVNESDPDLVNLLLGYGANVDILDSYGRTPLEAAQILNSEEIIALIRNRIITLHQRGLEVSERNLQNVAAMAQQNQQH